MNKEMVELLQCPQSGGPLTLSEDGQFLISEKGQCRYPIDNDIALLLVEHALPFGESDQLRSSANNSLSAE